MVFEGEAGQGIQTAAAVLLPMLRKSGCHVNSYTEYMSRIRGGSNTTGIRVAGKPRSAYVSRIDVLFAMSSMAASRLEGRLHAGTLIFAETGLEPGFTVGRVVDMPIRRLAAEAGGALYASSAVAGAASALLGISAELVADLLQELFSAKGASVVTANRAAAAAGREFIGTVTGLGSISLQAFTGAAEGGYLLMDGTAALGLGTIMAGCNFISSYPMSPGTGLLTFLAGHVAGFGIVVDQAEDEIAAINAALGASYAGARSIVTTSGGGFDLMQEGMSLAGMIETPVVIHVGQRPGPATGLPTRTGQEDLSLVIHAGHGEFARAVFAPGSLAELIKTVQHAFSLAQRFQIPVVILTDQYLLDAAGTIALDAPFVATFVARVWAGDVGQTAALIGEAISFRGFALVDVLQPCVVFNKLNTWQWLGEHIRPVSEEHDPSDRIASFGLALQEDPFPLGLLYRNEHRELYEELAGFDPAPLFTCRPDTAKLQALIETFR